MFILIKFFYGARCSCPLTLKNKKEKKINQNKDSSKSRDTFTRKYHVTGNFSRSLFLLGPGTCCRPTYKYTDGHFFKRM